MQTTFPAPQHQAEPGTEDREVRAADPRLSDETNTLLTAELRDVVGAERVQVPRERPHASRGDEPIRHGGMAYLSEHRFEILRATAMVLTFGGIISLITGDWWLLPLAAGLHLGAAIAVAVFCAIVALAFHH